MKVKGLIRSGALWGFLAVIGLMLHLFAAQPLYTTGDRLLAWVLLAMSLGTAFNYFKDSAGKVPLLPLASLQIYVMYGMAQFTQKEILIGAEWYSPPASAIHHAMILIVIGEIGLLLMFKAGRQISQRWKHSWPTLYPSSLERTKSGAAVYGLLGMAWYFVQCTQVAVVPIEIRNIIQMVFNPYLALVLVFYWAHHNKGRRFRFLGLILVCVMAFSGLLSGMLEMVLVPIYLLILTDWIWGYTLKTKLIAASLLFFVILSPIKYHYRELALDAHPVQSASTLLYRFSLWKDAIRRTWEDPFAGEKSIEASANRTSYLLSLAQVIDWVPDIVPYNRGDGMVTAICYWVPRVFWPDKPSISSLINNRYAITFGYSTPEGVTKSTIGIYQPADGYWDFGTLGAIGYMMLYGMLLGVLFGPCRVSNSVATVLVAVFSANFFQNLVNLQYFFASFFSFFVGAWIALQGLGIADRLIHPYSRGSKIPGRKNVG